METKHLRPLQAHEAEALEALGLELTLEGEILTVSFRNGKRERWGLAQHEIADLPWAEVMRFEGRHYVKLPDTES